MVKFQYEQIERFGDSMTSVRPWNQSSLVQVERLNGRAAMIGFAAAVVAEMFSGKGIVGQLAAVLHWYLNLG